MEWSTFWDAVSAIGSIAAASAIIVAWRQLRFDAWLKAQEIWTSSDFTTKRSRIFQRINSNSAKWNEVEKSEGLDVCRKLDEFSRLIPFLPKQIAMSVWGVPYAKAWSLLQPLVIEEREKCNWPQKWDSFESLGTLALRKNPKYKNILPTE